MSRVSELVGTVVNGEPEYAKQINGEKFFTIIAQFNDVTIPVLMPECEVRTYTDIIKVTGCLVSFGRKRQLPEYYIYAVKIDSVDLDTPLSNNLLFHCTVTKVMDFKIDARGCAKLPLVVSDYSPLYTTSVLYLCVKDKDARQLKDKEKGYTIDCSGSLKPYRDVYEVNVTDIYSITEKE